MKKYVKYALALAAAALLAFLMVLIWNGNGHDRALRTCEGLSVEFSEEHNFVTADDIKAYLDEGYGAYIGQRVDSVDLHKVEALLDSRSAVLKSEAWITPDNIMHVKISQREPVVRFQTPTGGWNYNMKRTPSEGAPDDISFGGWALQALKAGKMAGIHLPGMEECIKKAVKCLKTRNYSEKAGFVYRATTNHKGGGGGLAGVGCLAMQLLGYGKEPEVANALRVMTDWAPTLDKKHMSGAANSQYYSYYAAQCKYQAGMAKNATPANLTLWKKWNAEMKALYPKAIITVMDQKTNQPYTIEDANGKPREIGHWVNGDSFNYDVMGTCLAALQLMVYYRYLPTTQLKATEVEADVESLSKDKTGEINVSIDI